jgi:ribosomal protein S18 acetylase RimI-like enzyme
VNIRAPREDEAVALADLFRRAEDTTTGSETADEIEAWWRLTVDREQDTRVAERDGELVGYGDVFPHGDSTTEAWLDLRAVDADAAEQLLAWAEDRGRERLRGLVRLLARAEQNDARLQDALARRGFTAVRSSYRMLIDAAAAPPPPALPPGLELRPFDPELHMRAVHATFEETFADTWDHVNEPYDDWRAQLTEARPYDPTLWLVAWDGDEIAGISLTFVGRGGDPAFGWVSLLGVRRPWRGRGLARALLLHSFQALAARGATRIGLGVDADSKTGADRLYLSAGMHVAQRFDEYEKRLAAARL